MIREDVPAKAALIAVLILARPLCLDCLCVKTGLSATEVDHYLTGIATSVELCRHTGEPCRACGNEVPLFSLRRSPN